MADKQSHLNGAYYGPSIPPPPRTYHRPGRSSGCGCGCCLLKCLFNIIITAVVIIGLAVLIFWLLFRPNRVKFHVTDVQLTEFNLTANNTLHYNLVVNMTVRNPNRRIGIYYDRIEARAYFEDQRFSTKTLTPFYQGHKNTSFLNPVLVGQQFVRLGAKETSKLNDERRDGVYSIDVKLYLRIRFKLGRIKTGRFKPRISCDLKVPFNSASNNSVAGAFETTRCGLDF
ncbi:Protein YLS9 [Hibiscus syriacus]|uniref:Protein YLS9 n=1 Tax=Hibiscus syriacus TaxID=106335 RepID=A0A6A2ZH48_HIBSY|nr:NDR1/HIN1-like protein 3 [Hibiscus syriacus]KAE8690295.1 Protein YLS9 [Hibiscus syriacus]